MCRVGGLKAELLGSRRPQTMQRSGKRTKGVGGLRLTHVVFQFNVLEQVALEVLRLTRSRRSRTTPIDWIPPEILTSVPDFWDKD